LKVGFGARLDTAKHLSSSSKSFSHSKEHFMSSRVRQLLEQMSALENELRVALNEQEHKVAFQFHGKQVEFERSVEEAHRQIRKTLLKWLGESSPRAILSVPFIYSLIVPLVLMDISVTLYQAICFRLYRIPRVRRSDYIAIDRHHLAYLNSIEKLNCMYCSYANGFIAYFSEIAARTEQYWCPIKHARKVLGSHARYARFLSYGQAENYHVKLEEYRDALSSETSGQRQ
jgi:hypothetical protein